MAPLAQAATLLNLGVAEGPTGAVIAVQSHIPLRGLKLLAALTCVLHRVGLQGVPVSRSAQYLALLCLLQALGPAGTVSSSQGPCHPLFKTLQAHLPIALGQMFLLQLPLATRCPKSTDGRLPGPCLDR